MRKPIQQSYRQFLSGISKTRELQELPMYHCGDNTYLWNIADATDQDFYDLLQELGISDTAADIRNFCGNLFCGVPSESGGYLYLYYYPARREIRMVRCLDGRLLPGRLGEKEHYTGRKALTQVCPDDKASNCGMCYILHLGEGHFIVYDGFGNNGSDEDVIYRQLLNQTPEGQQPVIDVWVMTHVHWDHIAGIHQFSKKYKDSVRVLNFVLNVPPFSNFMGRELRTALDFYILWLPELKQLWADAGFWRVHTGQRLCVGDAVMDFLYTQEDLYPEYGVINDTCLVSRVLLGGKRIFFPADVSSEYSCTLLHDAWGSELKSDYYQAAHHGWNTAALRFFDDVDPEIVLWPVRPRDWWRIQKFPATARMVQEMTEQKRPYYLSIDESYTFDLDADIGRKDENQI